MLIINMELNNMDNLKEFRVTRVTTEAEVTYVMADSLEEAEANIEKFADSIEWTQLNSESTFDFEGVK
tara:strand:- start:472 stop:675 length:204 start_codon:yes stop_codon:yes gene_type:complete